MTEMSEVKVTADPAWSDRWHAGNIGFHQSEHNAHLLKHWSTETIPHNSTVLVPLCGKSRDMSWLHSQGYRVVGVEMVEMACRAFFEEQGFAYERTIRNERVRFDGTGAAAGLTILCADLFSLSPDDIGGVNAWYDRAAIVALPPELWSRYAKWISQILPSGGAGLMMTFEYPQSERNGPPFSVGLADVQEHFEPYFDVEHLERIDLTEGNRWSLSCVHKPVIRLSRR